MLRERPCLPMQHLHGRGYARVRHGEARRDRCAPDSGRDRLPVRAPGAGENVAMTSSRRAFIAAALAALGGGSYWLARAGGTAGLTRRATMTPLVPPTGRLREYALEAKATDWSPTGRAAAAAWTYNGTVPGPEIRVTEGETLRVTLHNLLEEPTSIHWHGLPVPFSMD